MAKSKIEGTDVTWNPVVRDSKSTRRYVIGMMMGRGLKS